MIPSIAEAGNLV
uniref:Uncharacterized protein n=1 Tax=Lepeophtheirus salmonis TaxID=72036 RepID=A0A0K2TDR2_LEPSM